MIRKYTSNEIKIIQQSNQYIKELIGRLFPSPFEEIDIQSISSRNLAERLDVLEETERKRLIYCLYHFCLKLRQSNELVTSILTITNYTEPIQVVLKKLQFAQKKERKKQEQKNYDNEIQICQSYLQLLNEYNFNGYDWIFTLIARSIGNEPEKCITEKLLWTFCHDYFEEKEYLEIIEKCSTVIQLENEYEYPFPYKIGTPFIEHDTVIIDDIDFPDCIETTIRHFFNFIQPRKPYEIIDYWNRLNSPVKDSVIHFFTTIQGSRRANDGKRYIRKAWAEIITKLPKEEVVLSYKLSSLENTENNIEIKAGWSNYLKTIAYMKNDQRVMNKLIAFDSQSSQEMELQTELMCECLSLLSEGQLYDIEWCHGNQYEGIRDMKNGLFDILGVIRCSIKNVSRKIEIVMRDLHGLIRWSKL